MSLSGGEETILGPMLLLSYINELPNCLSNCEPRMCADDRHLTYADNDWGNIESSLSEDLNWMCILGSLQNKLRIWLKTNLWRKVATLKFVFAKYCKDVPYKWLHVDHVPSEFRFKQQNVTEKFVSVRCQYCALCKICTRENCINFVTFITCAFFYRIVLERWIFCVCLWEWHFF